MSTQSIIERLAELQLREQENKTKAAEYECEAARIRLEYTRRVCASGGAPPTAASLPS